MSPPDKTLAARLLNGDKRALARGISLVENDDPQGWQLVSEVYPHTGRATVIGFTGPPGVGKSTLLAALTKLERARERTIAVLSIDPSSPFTHGALLGDRLNGHPGGARWPQRGRAAGGAADGRVGSRSRAGGDRRRWPGRGRRDGP